jgi:hypothetical protein
MISAPVFPADSAAFHGGLPVWLPERELCLLMPVLQKLANGVGRGLIRKICNGRMSCGHLIKRHVGALRQTGLPESPICRFNVLRTLPLQISRMFHHSVRSNSWPKRITQPYRPSRPNRSHRESPERRCGKMVRKCTGCKGDRLWYNRNS